jgi:hypothetical protein
MKFKTPMIMISLLFIVLTTRAQGDLLITPKRVVFDGNKQKENLSLVNIGKDSATFTISFVQKNMMEDGSFVTLEKSDSSQMYAEAYLRVFPRKITLAPGEAQTVMLQCRRKPGMLPGEYRSHLYFRSEKNYTPLGMDHLKKDSSQVSVQLVPVYGISIPVIIHSGSINVTTSITDLRLISMEGKVPVVRLTLNRQGNISAYGDLKAEFIPSQGKSLLVANIKSIGIYTSIRKRTINLELNNLQGRILQKGKLKVSYTSPEGTKYDVFAESEISL